MFFAATNAILNQIHFFSLDIFSFQSLQLFGPCTVIKPAVNRVRIEEPLCSLVLSQDHNTRLTASAIIARIEIARENNYYLFENQPFFRLQFFTLLKEMKKTKKNKLNTKSSNVL